MKYFDMLVENDEIGGGPPRYTFYFPADAIRCTALDGLSIEC